MEEYTFEDIIEFMKKDPDWEIPEEEREEILNGLRHQLVRD